uniref:Uncharacterized protein n=1 Tax=Rhizophora mucronata TaxID=61149 RepID=A0A2P2ISX9_RHIMU
MVIIGLRVPWSVLISMVKTVIHVIKVTLLTASRLVELHHIRH